MQRQKITENKSATFQSRMLRLVLETFQVKRVNTMPRVIETSAYSSKQTLRMHLRLMVGMFVG